MSELCKGISLLSFETLDDWMDWLEKHHADTPAIWLKLAKKGSGFTSISYEQAREGALIYGWIDGVANRLDDKFFLQRMTPRRPRSIWSNVNRQLVEGYIKEGRMQPSGMTQVEAAKADGRWDRAYVDFAKMEVPEDFQKAINASPKANLETITKSAGYAFLYHINDAKKPETRERRIQKYVVMLKEGKTLYD